MTGAALEFPPRQYYSIIEPIANPVPGRSLADRYRQPHRMRAVSFDPGYPDPLGRGRQPGQSVGRETFAVTHQTCLRKRHLLQTVAVRMVQRRSGPVTGRQIAENFTTVVTGYTLRPALAVPEVEQEFKVAGGQQIRFVKRVAVKATSAKSLVKRTLPR